MSLSGTGECGDGEKGKCDVPVGVVVGVVVWGVGTVVAGAVVVSFFVCAAAFVDEGCVGGGGVGEVA